MSVGSLWARWRGNHFARVLLLVTVSALALRVGYVVLETWDAPLTGDQTYYSTAANQLSAGDGFVVPDTHRPNRPGTAPDAQRPPLTALVLAPVSWITGWSANAQRIAMAIIGSLAVAAIGLAGRAAAGDRAGIVAAIVAAVYPNLWVHDGLVTSEALTVLAVAVSLFVALRFVRHPTAGMALALGAACGFAALARAELFLLTPLLALPTVLLPRAITKEERVHNIVIALGAIALVLGPWMVFNLGRFEKLTFITTNDGSTMLGANCDRTYFGPSTGLWLQGCVPARRGEQSVVDAGYRHDALRSVNHHADRAPIVAIARVARTWGVFRPGDMEAFGELEGRPAWVTIAGAWFYYPLLLLAIAGVVVMRTRFDRLWQLLVPFVLVTVVSALTYGQTRFRLPAEPSLVILAAVAIDAFVPGQRIPRGSRRAEPTDDEEIAAAGVA